MDESPRWLVVRGYHGLALRTLQKAARWNKASLPPAHRILQILKDGQHEVRVMRGEEGRRGERNGGMEGEMGVGEKRGGSGGGQRDLGRGG